MFFSDSLQVPPLVGPFKMIRGSAMRKKKDEPFGEKESQRRFEAALRGARVVGHKPMKGISPKRPKSQPKPGKKSKASA